MQQRIDCSNSEDSHGWWLIALNQHYVGALKVDGETLRNDVAAAMLHNPLNGISNIRFTASLLCHKKYVVASGKSQPRQ